RFQLTWFLFHEVILHSKKKRATRADAHRARETGILGGMSDADYLSDAERDNIADDAATRLEDVTTSHFPRTQNLEYAILKAHLIVEYAITEFIRCTSRVLVETKDIRFSFSQKIEIAVLNVFGAGCSATIPSVEMLNQIRNQIRNQVAHRCTYERSLLNQLIQIPFEDADPRTLSDRQCITCLRNYCEFQSLEA
ncbi:MAG: hypothetical protein KDA87_23790, partial [Planctomycetales bacterium]|nr:hypothetical protein [Planctomycetales bacterium]